MSGGGGDGGGQFTTNPWPGAGTGGGSSVLGGHPAGDDQSGAPRREGCEALQFEARLRNVDSEELAHVSVGDVLSVVFESDPTPHVAVFRRVVEGLATSPVGALVERLVELLPCLEILEFEAEVLAVDGGNTRVRVRSA